jgi:GT2 family glycosyltransferase/glycosyltransferase involved in cell wall biosynthesis
VTSSIWVVQVVRPFPDRIAQGLSDDVEAAQVRRAARLVGLDRPLLWTQDPRAASLVDRLGVAGVVYDLTDDWAAFELDPKRRANMRDQIESLGRRADVVIACSRSLADDARGWGTRPMLLPNAVDPRERSQPAPDQVVRLARPRLGYAGTLHSARLNVRLLADAARLRPEWSFVFLGPDMLEPRDRRRLFERENVHYLGLCGHAEVRSYLSGLDVGLLPNLVTDFTRSLDPLKTYEYLAAGLPVIATPAGIPDELARHVDLVTTAEQLVEQAETAMREDNPTRAQARRAAVAGETWNARAAEIERTLGVRAPEPFTSEVSVVIVNFNTCELLERCLRDLSAQAGVMLQTVVVDNASDDSSRELVRERFPQVELIELPENVGFARANNLAFERCRGEYVLLLNSDAFVQAGAVSELLAAARRHPRAAAIGARLLNADGTLQRSAWPFPHPARYLLEAFGLHRILRRSHFYEDLGIWKHDEERSVDFVIGACLLLRIDALRQVGGFDERFWLYGEETDLQRRLAARGWSVIFCPTAQAVHIGGASQMAASLRLRHFYSAQRRFLRKHVGLGAWPIARLALVAGSCLRGRWRAAWVALTFR